MRSIFLKISGLLLFCTIANANPYCPDFTGTYSGKINGAVKTLELSQVGCDFVKSSEKLPLLTAAVTDVYLTNIPSLVDGQIVSARIIGNWLQVQVLTLKNGTLDSTTLETLSLDSKNNLMITLKTFLNIGVQSSNEDYYELERTK
jgi:hypothetical protein